MFNFSSSTLKILRGFSLIELMLALTISFFVLSVILTLYLTAEKNFQMQTALSNIQENARMAVKLLTSDISMAGYIGCAKLTNDFPLKNFLSYELNLENKIKVNQNKITVRHANKIHVNLSQRMTDYSTLTMGEKSNFSRGDILIISDCKSAEIFQIKNISKIGNKQKITTSMPLVTQYDITAEVSKLEVNTYFVDKTTRKTLAGQTIYALYMTDIHSHKTELVEGIDGMHVNLEPNGVAIELTLSSLSTLKKTWYSYIALRECV